MLNSIKWTLIFALGCEILLDISGASTNGPKWSDSSAVFQLCNGTDATYPNTILNETVIEGYVVFTCDIGFEMEVDDHGDAILAVCNDTSGEWEFVGDQSPNCQRISCASPPLPSYGDFSDVRGFGESGNYTCNQEYIVDGEVSATCLADGSWSSEPPSCKISCPASLDSLTTAYLNDGSCIDVSQSEETWAQASETCTGLNGSLAIISTNDTFQFVQDLLSNVSDSYGNGYWIGGYEKPANYSWTWHTDSDAITNFFWAGSEPSSGDKDIHVILSKQSNWQWAAHPFDGNLDDDDDALGYVCQFDSVCSTVYLDGELWAHDYNGACYYFQNDGQFKWVEAKETGNAGVAGCSQVGNGEGFLAEIRDQATQYDIVNHIDQNGWSRSYWIGAERDDGSSEDRTWLWVDGSTISTTWWGPDEPNDNGNEECIDLYQFDGKYFMNDDKCGNPNGFLCQFSATNSTVVCGDPGVPYHGIRNDVSVTTFLPGESIEFTCDEGYAIEGAANIICETDGTWNNTLPSCNAVDCDSVPNVGNASLLFSTSTEYRGTAVYGCTEGYELVGNPSIYCEMNGNWSSIGFTCQVQDVFTEIATSLPGVSTLIPTAQMTTEQISTTPMTTEIMSTGPITTEQITTAQVSTEQTTTAPMATSPMTTAPMTTEQVTSAPMTTKLMTTAPVTTEQITTAPVTTGQVTTASMTTEEMNTAPMTTEQITTASVTTEQITTAPITTEQITTEPMTTEQIITEPITTEEITTASITTDKLTTAPMTTKQVTTAPMTTEKLTTEQTATTPGTTKPISTEQITTTPVTTKPITTTPTSTDQMTTAKISTVKMTVLPTTKEKMPTTLKISAPTTIGKEVTSATPSTSAHSATTSPAEPTQTNAMVTTSKVEEPFPVVLVATLASIFGLLFIIIFLICIVVVISSPKSNTSDSHNLLMTDFGPVNGSTDAQPKDNIYEELDNSVFANDEYRENILNYRPSMTRIASTTSWTSGEGAVGPKSVAGSEPIYAKVYKDRELSVVRFPSTFEERLAEKGLLSFDPSKRSDLSPSDLMGNRDLVFEGTE